MGMYLIVSQNILVEQENWQKIVDYQSLVEGQSPPFNLDQITSLYKAGRKWSLDYFETMYEKLGTKFDLYYFESKAGEFGFKAVQDNLRKGVFKKDQGAVIFEGEKYGLHTRVFVNSKNLPVYEAKDLGLAVMKYEDYPYDRSFIITANEVDEYFRVVLKAMEMVDADLANKTTHIGHGMLGFKHGKMSSRTGEIISGRVLLDLVKEKVVEKITQAGVSQDEGVKLEGEKLRDTAEKVALASIKYSILRSGIGHDIAYDEEEATSLVGNTGPYLLYTCARTSSVLSKAGVLVLDARKSGFEFDPLELDVLRHIYKFPEQVVLAGERLSPNIIAGFAYDLAQKYNAFYSKIPIIKASTEDERKFRLCLTQAVGQVLANSLNLLGIPVVDKM